MRPGKFLKETLLKSKSKKPVDVPSLPWLKPFKGQFSGKSGLEEKPKEDEVRDRKAP